MNKVSSSVEESSHEVGSKGLLPFTIFSFDDRAVDAQAEQVKMQKEFSKITG